jgi:pimeloyl-ACP methyl ester carboxylesterase
MTERYFDVEPGIRLRYLVDDFTDPWRRPETVLMIHGFAESADAWWGWVPYLARRYRVIRLDLRGFGKSTPLPETHAWSMDRLLDDVRALAGHLGESRVHLVGAKSGGSMALALAARDPGFVRSVVAVTPPATAAAAASQWLAQIEKEGVLAFARTTMAGRLGSKASPQEVEWWVQNIQGRSPRSTLIGYLKWVHGLDLREEVKKIRCPALIITTTGSGLRTVEGVRAWQSQIAGSKLLVLESDAWHAAGSLPDECAKATADFLAQLNGRES